VLAQVLGEEVTVHLEGERVIEGVVREIGQGFIALDDPENNRVLLVNREKITHIEVRAGGEE